MNGGDARNPEPLIVEGPMKNPIRSLVCTTLLASSLALPLSLRAEDASPGHFDFGKFSAAEGAQLVEVNLRSTLIGLAARLTEKAEPEVSDLLRSLKSVRVNVVGMDDKNRAELGDRIAKARAELDSKGWEQVVRVEEKKESVGVYLKHRGEEAIEGLVVMVVSGNKEVVFVNIVGDLRPEKLALIGERLGIEPLRKAGEVVKKQG